MDIAVRLAFDEDAAIRLLNWLATENARQIALYDQAEAREAHAAMANGAAPRRRSIPGLYESGVYYEREEGEIWGDVLNTLWDGHEDCDALAAWRAGELMARGWRALRPPWWVLQQQGWQLPADAQVRYPGDEGFEEAMHLRPNRIKAEVFVKTNAPVHRPGMYHCVVRYKLRPGGRWYYDDPSSRLGMLAGRSAEVDQGLAGGLGAGAIGRRFAARAVGQPIEDGRGRTVRVKTLKRSGYEGLGGSGGYGTGEVVGQDGSMSWGYVRKPRRRPSRAPMGAPPPVEEDIPAPGGG